MLESRTLLATLGLGDVAFSGFQGTTPDRISLVLLKDVDSGTVLTVTDNAWNGSAMNANEGNSIVTFLGSFAAGTQINYDATRVAGQRWAVGTSTASISDVTSGTFSLGASGENLLIYNGNTAPSSGTSPAWVAAFSTTAFQTTGTSSSTQTYLPAIFSGTDSQLSLGLAVGAGNQNGAYTGGSITGTIGQIRESLHSRPNWSTFTTAGAQPIPVAATFTVQDVINRAPTGLLLSNNSLAENAVNGYVGIFTTVDPDIGNTFTYSLVSGTGSVDNGKFSVVGNSLRASTLLDYEVQNRFSVRIRSTDQGGLFFEQSFGIQLLDVNESPQANLRFVSYNIASSSNGGTPRSGLDTILNGIASEIVGGIARQIDLLAIQEVASQASTGAIVASQLNTRYGSNIYATGLIDGATTGSGTQGVVYNTQSLQLLEEYLIGTSTTTGQPRQTIRYRFQPVGGLAGSDFYVYNSHFKSADDADSRTRRLLEAQAIRADADALGDGRNIFYVGDFNVYTGSEPAFQQLIAAGSGQAFDPINRIGSWSNNTSFLDTFTQAPALAPTGGLTGGGLDDRFDFQLLSGELFDGNNLEYRPGTYRAFGNNGSVALNGNINDAASTALSALFDRSTILNLLTTVSDHLPVVADVTFTSDALINHAPAGSDGSVSVYENQAYTFLLSDFGFSDPDDNPPDAIDAVKVTALPATGALSLNGQAVAAGQLVTAVDITAGRFRYTPPANVWGSPLSGFTFQVRDNGGTSFGGVDLDPTPSTLQINVIPTPGVTVSDPSPSGITSEAAGAVTFSVVLESPPAADVSIAVNSSDESEGQASVSVLVFTPANWNVAQSVTVTGVDDASDDGDVAYTIILGTTNSSDPAYQGINPADVSLKNIDNDVALDTKFYVVNDGTIDATYEYAADGTAVENYPIASANSLSRGIVASADGLTLWTVDRNRNVYVYSNSGALLGSWSAGTLSATGTVEGIATDGVNIWIVDSKADRIYYYAGAASRRNGTQSATSFPLTSGNTNPKDLVFGKDVSGSGFLWVLNDASTDKVFRYSVNPATGGIGALNSWNLSSLNKVPTGITLDPGATGGDLWVVDNGTTKQVFKYINGRTSSSPSGAAVFQLGPANSNPQGIADPPPAAFRDDAFAEDGLLELPANTELAKGLLATAPEQQEAHHFSVSRRRGDGINAAAKASGEHLAAGRRLQAQIIGGQELGLAKRPVSFRSLLKPMFKHGFYRDSSVTILNRSRLAQVDRLFEQAELIANSE